MTVWHPNMDGIPTKASLSDEYIACNVTTETFHMLITLFIILIVKYRKRQLERG